MSIGVLAVGMIFVAGVFPVGLYFATISTERSIAAVVADEAFAKVRLYGVRIYDDVNFPPSWASPIPRIGCIDFNDVTNEVFYQQEYAYPSDITLDISKRTYCWSAICRFPDPNNPPPLAHLVEVTVFVCRRAGAGEKYWYRAPPPINQFLPGDYSRPFNVSVLRVNNPDELVIEQKTLTYGGYNIEQKTFINDGYTIIDNATGQLYRVLERYPPPRDQIILLDRPWQAVTWPGVLPSVWVIPPPFGGGRNPCIAVYQRTIRF